MTGGIKCPKCGSRKVAKILYGLPAFDDELEEQARDRKAPEEHLEAGSSAFSLAVLADSIANRANGTTARCTAGYPDP